MMSTGPSRHPYYPLDAHISGYAGNESSVLALLIQAGVGCLLVLSPVHALVSFWSPSLCRADRLAVLWFVLSGFLHICFEGYFVLNHDRMASAQDVFAQLWKEYALSDSRYLTSDTLVLCLEAMTVMLFGPLCLIVASLIASRHPLRHPLQIVICVCHLYGDILYYATSLFDHFVHDRAYSRPEPYYFWLYYFLMNFIWIVVPSYYLWKSVSIVSRAIQRMDDSAEKQKTA